ncbi:MAG: hypothetical protein K8I00_01010 [Candidatus Omnitrophica bacterium]|nr:hypothetical protein [Candidatus Omnitrophota bacterium]
MGRSLPVVRVFPLRVVVSVPYFLSFESQVGRDYPSLPANSIAILKKLGFQYAGERDHPEDGRVWEWHLQNEVANDGN